MWGNCWEWPVPPTETVNGLVLQWMFVLRDEGSWLLFLRGRRTSGGAQWENGVYWRRRKPGGQEMSTGRPGVLQFMGSQRVRHDRDRTELKRGCQRERHFPVCPAGGASDKPAGGRQPRDGYATGRAHGRAGWPPGLEMLTRVWLRERGASGDPAAHFPRGKDGLSGLILLPMKPWKRLSSSSGWLAAAYSCQLPVNRWHELCSYLFSKKGRPEFFFFKGQMIIVIIGPFREQLLCALISSEQGAWCALCGNVFCSAFSIHSSSSQGSYQRLTSDLAATLNTAWFFFFLLVCLF